MHDLCVLKMQGTLLHDGLQYKSLRKSSRILHSSCVSVRQYFWQNCEFRSWLRCDRTVTRRQGSGSNSHFGDQRNKIFFSPVSVRCHHGTPSYWGRSASIPLHSASSRLSPTAMHPFDTVVSTMGLDPLSGHSRYYVLSPPQMLSP